MTRLFNDPADFRTEFLRGLVAANPALIQGVPGGAGVASIDAPTPGQVGVVIGGGSGHYPAFAGLVGPGLCHGAVVGEIFTSPSARAVTDLIEATDSGHGVVLLFGNYSGDVMHFGLAAQAARREGRDVRIVLVTDDIASAKPEAWESRRGVAGGFYVFSAAAAAARAGLPIAEVEAVAQRVNARVHTLGIAFGGCTFPGAQRPLFEVPDSQIALGLGIHGEPGIEMVPTMPAAEAAELLLDRLLAERPADAMRVRVLVNGLGATKYEELFVLTGALVGLLQDRGCEVVETGVGEFVTSLDMAGCSVTLCWTTPELDALLAAPATAPALVRVGGSPTAAPDMESVNRRLAPREPAQPVTADQDLAAATAVALLSRASDAIGRAVDELGQLDSVAGDGDHGLGMSRGFGAAVEAARRSGPGLADVLAAAGEAFADHSGGASGALWGAGLAAAGHSVGLGESPGSAAAAAVSAVADLGRAAPGDKTVLDALMPFAEVLTAELAEGSALSQAWTRAAAAAQRAAESTSAMASRRGRAAVHAEASIGTPDPGCVSFAIAAQAVAGALVDPEGSTP